MLTERLTRAKSSSAVVISRFVAVAHVFAVVGMMRSPLFRIVVVNRTGVSGFCWVWGCC